MKHIHLLLASVMLAAHAAMAADATFSWLPNQETDLAGYRIHYGPDAAHLDQVVDAGLPQVGDDGRVRFTMPVPDTATSFAATAYDAGGNESELSNVVTYDPAPSSPGELMVIRIQVEVDIK